MSVQPRVAKVLATLLVSMTTGAIVLLVLHGNPPSAGVFSLYSYHRLTPVEKAACSRVNQTSDRWQCIEIYYSNTKAGDIEQLASLNGFTNPEDLNCHFVVCNGLGGNNGQIQPTEKWQRQWSAIPDRTWYGNSRTIRICVVADGKTNHPTDFQTKRAEALVENLCAKFDIDPRSAFYPTDWR